MNSSIDQADKPAEKAVIRYAETIARIARLAGEA
jgi:hypothetical protein